MLGKTPEQPHFLESKLILAKYGNADKITAYFNAIMDHNRKVNLVSRETTFEKLRRIGADCLAPFEFLQPPSGRIFDIGPGAGFPVMMILLAYEDVEAVFFERTRKKAVFLRQIIDQLDLSAEVIDKDFLDAKDHFQPGSFDYGFMKLVRLSKKILHGAIPLLKPSGQFLHYANPGNSRFGAEEDIARSSFSYYLDDNKQLRWITVFSGRG